MDTITDKSDEERSVIGDKGDIGFIDIAECRSVCSYNPTEESDIVLISVPFPFLEGRPQSGFSGETICDKITIKNTTNDSLDLWSIKIYDSKPEGSFTLSSMEPPTSSSDVEYVQIFKESCTLEDRVLLPGKTLTIWLSCKPKEIGLHSAAVHFSVGDENETIERLVFLLAEDKISKSLFSSRPYHRGRKKKQQVVVDVFSQDACAVSSRPPKVSNKTLKHRLPFYAIPKDIREMVENKQIPDAIIEGLSKKNYASYFKALVNMEEIKMEEDMRDYDMHRITLGNTGSQFLTLEVPGLAEKRPSLVCGDYIYAKHVAENDHDITPPYQGYIYRVEAEKVYLKFDKQFHLNHRANNLYNVQFTYNRLNMRRLYQAIEAAECLDSELLFPSDSLNKRCIRTTPLISKSCMLNEEQILSIEMILGCKGGAPYVIHGPPGTGKTRTLVEAILQLYTTRKNARILVCASSNSAADHVLERILGEKAVEVQMQDLFRLNALSRSFEDINPDLVDFCFVEDFVFKCPPLVDLKHRRIIISTYSSAALLYAEGIKRGHFSHIFLDEAGQASEPETMIPLCHLVWRNTVVILAGDPLQLGPVVFSRDAGEYGLGKSYLERLFECWFYENGDKNYVTKLVRNYRCHPEILYLPSELFYNGELMACKDEDKYSSLTWMDLLPNKDFPMLFIGIQGFDEREGTNPSWFNRIEASKVVEIIRNLTEDKGVNEQDIGVITPYRQQVLKIKIALESLGRSDVKVGSVEQFQGQERDVIIISTVRSTIKHNEFDKIHYLGFLSNPRRFNVAITRARSLLILIGNPHIICKDLHWNKILWRCSDNGSYQGCFLPEKQESPDESFRQDYLDDKGAENFQSSREWDDGGENLQPSAHSWDEGVGWDDIGGEDLQPALGWNAEWNECLQPSQGWDDAEGEDLQPSEGVRQNEEFLAEVIPEPVVLTGQRGGSKLSSTTDWDGQEGKLSIAFSG